MPVTKFNYRQSPDILVRTITAATHNETETRGTIVLLCNSASNNITVNLPTAVGNMAVYLIKKTADANSVTVDPAGSETLDEAPNAVLNRRNEAITVVSDNVNMRIF